MNRSPDSRNDRGENFIARPYENMPSVTDRRWGAAGPDDSFGPPELGGFGDFRQTVSDGRADRPAQRVSQRGRGPRAARSDHAIADELYHRLTEDETLDASEILLGVEDGVITLTGEVPVRSMKHRAEDLAGQVRGAREVVNRIRVDNGEASFGPSGEAVRSGLSQKGSGFSSETPNRSGEDGDPVETDRRSNG